MEGIFLKLVSMSLSAGWLVLAVLMLRLLLRKAPKWICVLLWGLVAVRLLMPFTPESSVSLVPEDLADAQLVSQVGQLELGRPDTALIQNNVQPEAGFVATFPTGLETVQPPRTVGNTVYPVLGWVWLAGVGLMLGYTLVSYVLLRRRVETAVRLRDNIFRSENVDSPFVLGILFPRIYLPFSMEEETAAYVIAHEQAHIRRKDHWWKPFGFLLLSLHWFNPLLWLGYILLCRDIELACDEKVIRQLDQNARADYTQALVACSVNRRRIAACPLAFGEVGVKQRVKSVMHYKKPAFWIVLTALLVCVAAGVCFLTQPKTTRELPLTGDNVNALDTESILEDIRRETGVDGIYVNGDTLSVTLDADFCWAGAQAVRYFFQRDAQTYRGQLQIDPTEDRYRLSEAEKWTDQERRFLLQLYLEALKYLPQSHIWAAAPADRYLLRLVEGSSPSDHPGAITYSAGGVCQTAGWQIHLSLQPLHADGEGFSGKGQEVLHLFYGKDPAEELPLVRSGENSVYAVAFPQGTSAQTYVDGVSWLTIEPGEEFAPFRVWLGDKEVFGHYSIFDAETLENLSFLMPSGLSPQTYIFGKADPTRAYVITLRTDEDGPVYAFGAKFPSETLDSAVNKAILAKNGESRFPDAPDGRIKLESHYLLGVETASGTPLAGQTGHIELTKVYVQYVYAQYAAVEGVPSPVAGICTPAVITFYGNPAVGYECKEFWEPQSGSEYARQIREHFPEKIAQRLLDSYRDGWYARELESRCLTQAQAYLARLQGDEKCPVMWLYEPESREQSAFRFEFDVPCERYNIAAEGGELFHPEAEDDSQAARAMDLIGFGALFWRPAADEDLLQQTRLDFALLKDDSVLYEGSIRIEGRKMENGMYAYAACLDCEGLEMQIHPENVGAIIRPIS